jgi:hypothetical protein
LDRGPGEDSVDASPPAATADASARRASLPPHRTRDRNRDVDATIFLQAFDTPGRRAQILDARVSRRARARIMIGSNAVARRRASPRNPARAHPPSTPRNQQQGYWVAEPYLLSCFAHFGACASCSRKRTVCDSRNVPDTRVTSTVFFAGAVFQATFRVLTRPRFRFLSEKKGVSFDLLARRAFLHAT